LLKNNEEANILKFKFLFDRCNTQNAVRVFSNFLLVKTMLCILHLSNHGVPHSYSRP